MHVINHNRGPKKVMKIPSVAQQLELLDDNKDPKVNTSVKKNVPRIQTLENNDLFAKSFLFSFLYYQKFKGAELKTSGGKRFHKWLQIQELFILDNSMVSPISQLITMVVQ